MFPFSPKYVLALFIRFLAAFVLVLPLSTCVYIPVPATVRLAGKIAVGDTARSQEAIAICGAAPLNLNKGLIWPFIPFALLLQLQDVNLPERVIGAIQSEHPSVRAYNDPDFLALTKRSLLPTMANPEGGFSTDAHIKSLVQDPEFEKSVRDAQLRFGVELRIQAQVSTHSPLYLSGYPMFPIEAGIGAWGQALNVEASFWDLFTGRYLGKVNVDGHGEFVAIAWVFPLYIAPDLIKDISNRLADEIYTKLYGGLKEIEDAPTEPGRDS